MAHLKGVKMAENSEVITERVSEQSSEGFGVLVGNLAQHYFANQSKAALIRTFIPVGMGIYSVSMVLLGYWLGVGNGCG